MTAVLFADRHPTFSMSFAFNLFCRDIERQHAFYRAVLGWNDDAAAHSPIFRALRRGEVQLGFNAWSAYALLGLSERRPAAEAGGAAGAPVTAYATFECGDPAEVDRAAERVGAFGGRTVKPPFATYYGQWQVVLADLEGNVFRLASTVLPPGTDAAPTPF